MRQLPRAGNNSGRRRDCRKGRRPGGGNAGFTLVEVLVSMALLALILALLPVALKLGSRAWSTSARLQHEQARAVAESYLAARLALAMPLQQRDAQGVSRIVFRGSPRSLTFVATSSGGPAGTGLFAYDLAVRSDGAGRESLWLAWRPYRPLASALADTGADTGVDAGAEAASSSRAGESTVADRVLVPDLADFGLRYFGLQNGARQWSDGWQRTDALPELVELSLSARSPAPAAPPLPLVIELRLREIL